MKRLTEYTIPETGFSVVSEEKYKRIMMEEKPSLEKVYNRLKKIEDILGDDYDLDRLRELLEADREGRCVLLPCKVGDSVWYITSTTEICHGVLVGVWLNIYTRPTTWIEVKYVSGLTGEHTVKSRIDLMLGKTVFLTREAAEAALKGEQDGNMV